MLSERIVILVDIAKDGQKTDFDAVVHEPSKYHSEKTGRGPLVDDWINRIEPVMCAYKLAQIRFNMFGFQTKVENAIFNNQQNLLINFHRQVFCCLDDWHGLNMEGIRKLEDQIKMELEIAQGRIQSEEPHALEGETASTDETRSAKSVP